MQFNQPLNPTFLFLPFSSIEDLLDLPWNRDGSGGGSERDGGEGSSLKAYGPLLAWNE